MHHSQESRTNRSNLLQQKNNKSDEIESNAWFWSTKNHALIENIAKNSFINTIPNQTISINIYQFIYSGFSPPHTLVVIDFISNNDNIDNVGAYSCRLK